MNNGGTNDNSGVDPEFLQDFILETREHLENIEISVLNLETDPDNQEIIHGLFRAFHTIKGLAGFVEQSLVQEIAHRTENLLDDCRKNTININKSVVNLILTSADFIEEICNDMELCQQEEFIRKVSTHLVEVETVNPDSISESYDDKEGQQTENIQNVVKKIGEILIEEHKMNPDEVKEILEKQKIEKDLKFGEIAIKEKKLKAKEVLEGIRKQRGGNTPGGLNSGFIRVPTGKVDNLVNIMGELIITQSQVEQEAEDRFSSNDNFNSKLSNMSRIMKEMQYLTMSLRMVSLKSTFQKINRIARDTIDEMGKDVEFSTYGDETEIDRNIADKLLEPLVHLVKNAISHGIEDLEIRNEKNKKPKGKVQIKAYSKRGSVYIEVTDDGGGINLKEVYKKASKKGLVNSEKKYTDKELIELIFLPGFSTSRGVDQISGRGVGMDVVKTEVSRIGGKIEVLNSPGKGCTFLLKIPINLAVMNGIIIELQGSHYIIPTLNVRQIIQPEEGQWVEIKGKCKMIKLRDKIIPIIDISRIFSKKNNKQAGLLILLELEQDLIALPVEKIVDQREIVVKPLGEAFSGLNFVSGASILGDGRVSLILDIEYLFKMEGVI